MIPQVTLNNANIKQEIPKGSITSNRILQVSAPSLSNEELLAVMTRINNMIGQPCSIQIKYGLSPQSLSYVWITNPSIHHLFLGQHKARLDGTREHRITISDVILKDMSSTHETNTIVCRNAPSNILNVTIRSVLSPYLPDAQVRVTCPEKGIIIIQLNNCESNIGTFLLKMMEGGMMQLEHPKK